MAGYSLVVRLDPLIIRPHIFYDQNVVKKLWLYASVCGTLQPCVIAAKVMLGCVCLNCCQGDKTLDGYQKKKYVCKLLFIFLLGHDIDFGHMEAVNLLSSNKYTEKQIVRYCYFQNFCCGYKIYCSVM